MKTETWIALTDDQDALVVEVPEGLDPLEYAESEIGNPVFCVMPPAN